MFRNTGFFLFLLLSATSSPAEDSPVAGDSAIKSDNTRIVDGQVALNRRDFPYQVSLQYLSRHICGGSIINEQHILTFVICVMDRNNLILPSELTAVVGNLRIDTNSTTTVFKEIESVIVHEEFQIMSPENSIAILKIKGSFEFTESIDRIRRASTTPAVGTSCRVSGWGSTVQSNPEPSPALQFVDVSISANENCNTTNNGLLAVGMVCAGYENGGRGPCEGDRGAPLVCDGKLAGVTGYGGLCGSAAPVIYLDVAYFEDWIHTKASSNAAFVNLYVLATSAFIYLRF
ncbi:putative serine-type endopeptidase [Trypoxylus dichotomus]